MAGTFRFDRGFTGHEHYADLKIINMNGRLYDPVIARFFSPDNFVQAPSFTQSYNRYSYCLNNPLQYTDPSGESIVLAMILGAAANVVFQSLAGNINGNSDLLCSFFVGGLAGLAGGAAGGATAAAVGVGGFLGGAASGAAAGAASCFITGTGNALIAGNDLATSLKCGLMGGAIGALGGALMGGVSRGILDACQGYNFWDGSFYEEFATGEIVPFANHSAIADYYNESDIANRYDAALISRYQEMFGITSGDYKILEITSRPSDFGSRNKKIGMNYKLQFISLEENHVVGGFVSGNSTKGTHIHISPHTISCDDIVFRAIACHELIHAYHYYLGATIGYAFSEIHSERVAYQYTFNTYIFNGYVYRAACAMNTALRLNFWGSIYPFSFTLPF